MEHQEGVGLPLGEIPLGDGHAEIQEAVAAEQIGGLLRDLFAPGASLAGLLHKLGRVFRFGLAAGAAGRVVVPPEDQLDGPL